MRIEGKINGPGDVEPRARLEFGRLEGVEHPGLDPEFIGQARESAGLVVEALLRLAQVEQAFLSQLEGMAGDVIKFLKQPAAPEAEVAQDGGGAPDPVAAGGPPEQPAPAHEVAVEPRLDVERAARVRHPLEPLPDHARGRERDDMAR